MGDGIPNGAGDDSKDDGVVCGVITGVLTRMLLLLVLVVGYASFWLCVSINKPCLSKKWPWIDPGRNILNKIWTTAEQKHNKRAGLPVGHKTEHIQRKSWMISEGEHQMEWGIGIVIFTPPDKTKDVIRHITKSCDVIADVNIRNILDSQYLNDLTRFAWPSLKDNEVPIPNSTRSYVSSHGQCGYTKLTRNPTFKSYAPICSISQLFNTQEKRKQQQQHQVLSVCWAQEQRAYETCYTVQYNTMQHGRM